MNIIYLQPTDVLFFRDGRPMTGSLAGHTAAWPLPDVTNHALHAALHRASLVGVHGHDHIDGEGKRQGDDNRKFGCLQTAGPFPVRKDETGPTWFFPRPVDALTEASVEVTLCPVRSLPGIEAPWVTSSLPPPLQYAVGNSQPPAKEPAGEPWISREAFETYLGPDPAKLAPETSTHHFLRDEEIADQEANLGIAIDPETQTTGHGSAKGKIYSAHYLRLREGFRLGLLADARDKIDGDSNRRRDLIEALLTDEPTQIVVGGQQRVCTAHREDASPTGLPLPRGLCSGFTQLPNDKFAVKWVLISPAIWPEIPPRKKDQSEQVPHPGGWLPNWVFLRSDPETGQPVGDDQNGRVLLTSGHGFRKAQRTKSPQGGKIEAGLVAAMVPKPIVVTGWALPNEASDHPDGGAKSTHLAVPAGAVYYFEADSKADAEKLANALNWHGAVSGDASKGFGTIKNRRSTLMGEKGFGLGVCGTWEFYNA